ncbi:carbamoyl-phosphate synthase domain-containing protein, partial [Bacillus sp. D-CC]
NDYLKERNIPGLAGIDTRKLTRKIRQYGTLRGRLCNMDADVEYIVSQLKATVFTDHVKRVSTKDPYPSPGRGHRVVLVDFGMKH